jgi:uncharacterized cupredoxin-like copper-binding protein
MKKSNALACATLALVMGGAFAHGNQEHADANMAHVKPCKAGEIVWQLTQPGEFRFACLQPGHFEAGMVGKVVVK